MENFVSKGSFGVKKITIIIMSIMSKLRSSVHEEGHLRQKEAKAVVVVPSIEAFRMQENKQIIQASADLDSKSQSCPKFQQNQEYFVTFPC